MDERYPALLDPSIGPTILRRVVLAAIYQAVLDGRANTARKTNNNPSALERDAAEALTFLNHWTTAEIAAAFGFSLPDDITPESLRVMSRGVARPRVRKQKAVTV